MAPVAQSHTRPEELLGDAAALAVCGAGLEAELLSEPTRLSVLGNGVTTLYVYLF